MKRFSIKKFIDKLVENDSHFELVKALELGWPQKLNNKTAEEMDELQMLVYDEWMVEDV
jgi:hypothetical protein